MMHPQAPADNAPAGSSAQAVVEFGSFRIGGMHLALPLSALREVVPCRDLVPLPCGAAYVIGGQQIRSAVVPVVDLRMVLDRPVTAIADGCVIVMIHEGHVLGLMAERIGDVFGLQYSRAGQVAAGTDSLFEICIPWGESQPVSVLSPPALLALARVPAILDPEPWRAAPGSGVEPGSHRPHLLMRSARMHMAIDAVAVHSTLPACSVTVGTLTHGACLGTVQVGQDAIAAFDLLALCGLGCMPAGAPAPGFVIDCAGARIAFLVDTLIDFANADPHDLVTLAPHAVPRPDLMRGLLPVGAVAAAQQWFAVDADALRACDEVASVAAATTTASGAAQLRHGEPQPSQGRPMLTFELDRKAAVPLDQVREILPFTAEMAAFGDGMVMGLAISRGRSIAVMNLARLAGWAEHPAHHGASILVVESGAHLTGFMIQRLCDIETTSWEPTMPTHEGHNARQAMASLQGAGRQQLVPVIDLQDLARRVQASEGWPARRESNPRPTA